jgi:hypothetical protein
VSERSPLLPKRAIEHHEVEPTSSPAGDASDKPEKSQAMVLYVLNTSSANVGAARS